MGCYNGSFEREFRHDKTQRLLNAQASYIHFLKAGAVSWLIIMQ
jgi:hypothetical protein